MHISLGLPKKKKSLSVRKISREKAITQKKLAGENPPAPPPPPNRMRWKGMNKQIVSLNFIYNIKIKERKRKRSMREIE